MRRTVELSMPLGYKLVDKVQDVDIGKAEQILLSRKQRCYTKALRVEDRALLYSRYIVCPDCNSYFSANVNMSYFGRSRDDWFFERTSKERIYDWASLQLSLFEEERIKELELNRAVERPRVFECPTCHCTSSPSSETRQVEFSLNKRKISIKSEIVSLEEILSLEWITSKRIVITFPVFEVTTFNLGKGRVDVKVVTDEGVVLAQRDISAYPELLKNGATYKLLTLNKIAMRITKRMFKNAWGKELAYNGKSFSLESMFKMTSFVGYPRNFYDCIPYAQDSYLVDKSFGGRAKQLVDSRRIDDVYKASSLPMCKSVRKCFFENPGLFFYLHEAEKLWAIVDDPNLFNSFLRSARVFEFLSELHMRPGIFEYLHDYAAVKGAKQMCRDVRTMFGDVRVYAIEYSCMSKEMKLSEQKRWKRKSLYEFPHSRKLSYSVPMHRPDEKIQDCTIDGYSFFWLRSSNEYKVAGKKMNNCLGSWQQRYAPVVCVKKGGKYVASISVAKNMILEAYGYDNSSIEDDESLSAAIEKWRVLFRLEWSEYGDCDDEFGEFDEDRFADMPF